MERPMSPPADGSGIRGEFVHSYRLDELKKYRSGAETLFYYQGVRQIGDREEDVVEASFLCFFFNDEDYERVAHRVSEIYLASSAINDDAFLRRHFIDYNKETDCHLICFDRFDSFFDEEENTFLKEDRYKDSIRMPGHPDPNVRRQILRLTSGINRVQLAGVSNSRLDSKSSYVWHGGKLKIVFCDYERDMEMSDDEDWMAKSRSHLNMFKDFLESELLKNSNPKTVSFLSCFECIPEDYPIGEKSLDMVVRHPFLSTDKMTYLGFFSTIQHWLFHQECSTFRPKPGVPDTLQLSPLNDGICVNGTWIRSRMRPGYNAYLRRDQRYQRHSAEGLVKFLRDVYEHFTDSGYEIELDDFFNDVEEYWPGFIDRLHEHLYRHYERVWDVGRVGEFFM